MRDLLVNYVTYNLWAHKRIVERLKQLDPMLWVQEQKSSFKSIRKTLLHMYDAKTNWYKRLNGTSLTSMPSEGFSGTNDETVDLLLAASQMLVDYMSTMTDESLSQFCHFKTLAGQEYDINVSDIILHCMNHSTFHRGQIITMLRNLDIDVLPSTDYITYVRTHPQA